MLETHPINIKEVTRMKKILALATALILTLSVLCTGALADLDPADIVGTWYLSTLEFGDTVVVPAEHDMEIVFVLYEDFTALARATYDEDAEGTWGIVDGRVALILADEDDGYFKVTLTLIDGNLVEVEEDGTKSTYRKVVEDTSALAASALEPSDIVGSWYLNVVKTDEGADLDPVVVGLDMVMVFNEDYTAIPIMDGQPADQFGTWAIVNGKVLASANENAVENGDGMVFTPVDGNLVVEQSGMTMIFSREKAGAETTGIPPVRTDSTLADFNGTWNAYLMELEGTWLPLDSLDLPLTLVIEDGRVTLTLTEEPLYMEGDVSEGVLTATVVDDGSILSFSLQVDGIISLAVGPTTTLYFEKADE